jgi:hypothetical protein
MTTSPDKEPSGSGSTTPADGSPSPVNGTQTSERASTESSDTYGADYVKSLRAENADRRKAAQAATEKAAGLEADLAKANERVSALQSRMLRAETERIGRDLMADPSDLMSFTESLSELLTEDGEPDEGKIKTAIVELLKAKPHLSKQRQAALADVGQGKAGPPDSNGKQGFAEWMRGTVK